MPTNRNASARAKANPKAATRAKRAQAKAKSRARSEKTARQLRRRAAIGDLNNLATELDLGVHLLCTKETRAPTITRRVRLLEAKCQRADLPKRLRAAVEQFVSKGGTSHVTSCKSR